ncbi:flagellar motor protein [Silvibacterium acidisoli]|uniref:flagellar motor protein n=1 Tax=Acidobacteriaceae bacterium ZG23-2 TaxID=2883246 RepID=UPI00406D447B
MNLDISSLIGILIAAAGVIAGLLLEGGHFGQVLQPTAALIVFGGTAGAVMLQFPLSTVLAAVRSLSRLFVPEPLDGEMVVKQILAYANKARRSGIVSLDPDLGSIRDPFFRQTLMLAVDGTEPSELRRIMEFAIDNQAELDEKIPEVFESAGGFSPTIGIIGAILGLIQVMQHLDHIDEVGRGIAVAFVATIYGVAAANLLFLPAAGKLRLRLRDEQQMKEMKLEGVISILEGMHPRMVEIKLRSFLNAKQDLAKSPIDITEGVA